MHVDWSCFALIIFEGVSLEASELLSYYSKEDTVAPGQWRLPGGKRVSVDTDPMETLVSAVRWQTGIDLSKKNSFKLIAHTDVSARPKHARRRKKYTHSERYYLVTISVAEYIAREAFQVRKNHDCELKYVGDVLEGSPYYSAHVDILRAHLAS